MSSRSRSPFPGSSQRRRAAASGADNDDPCPTTRFCNVLDECEMAAALSLPDSQPASPDNIDIASDDDRDPCPPTCSPTLSDTSENAAAWLAPKPETPETPKPPVDTPKPRNRFKTREQLRQFFAAKLAEQQPAAPSGEQQPAAQSSDAAYLTWREQLEGERAADQAAALDDDLGRLLAFCFST